jgi:DNA mismatch repair protein MutL
VKNALQAKELPPEETTFEQPSLLETPREAELPVAEVAAKPSPVEVKAPVWEMPRSVRPPVSRPAFGGAQFSPRIGEEDLAEETMLKFAQPTAEEIAQTVMEEKPYYRLVGELYNAFLVVETEKEVLFIDKHAAHERILYEKLASRKEVHSQQLLAPIAITLQAEEIAVLLDNASHLEEYGFEVEAFGADTVLVRAVPGSLAGTRDLKGILEGFASDLAKGGKVSFAEKCDRALFTVACKAALKAGIPNAPEHNAWVVERLMEDASLRFCPHGRPVIHPIPRREMEKFFDR